MENKREINTDNTVNNNPGVLKFDNPIKIEVLVLKAETLNLNHRILGKTLCERIVENVNLMKHEIHTDANEFGGTGIIIGRTVSASLDNEGRMTVVAEIDSDFFKDKKVEDFTLITVGIGKVERNYYVDYDFSCFAICSKEESAFYNNGVLIE